MESFKIAAADEEPVPVPASPIAQYFNSSALSIVVIAVLETEVPIDDSQTIPLLKNMLLPINPRFSSVMVDKKGVKQWRKVEVQLKDHVKVPIFPAEMSPEFYGKCQHDYISKIGLEPLSQHRPLWEIHLFKYPTCNAAGTIIFKLHHALGDGFSLMGALFSCLQRANDPSHPLTFPSVTTQPMLSSENGDNGLIRNVPRIVSSIFNSTADFCQSLKSSLVKDRQTPIRSGSVGVGSGPVSISTIIFSLHQIKQIKIKLGVTVNDVITGVIFLGTRLYMQSVSQESGNMDSTAVLMLNIRMLRSYTSVKEMLKPDSKSPWGNRFATMQMPIPKLTDAELSNPLEFIKKAREIIKGKRSSFGVYLTARLLEMVKKFRGPEAAAKFVYNTLNNSSMAITNMIGPVEKVALANHPIKGLYFMVFGSPQSLVITLVSYMGQMRIAIGSEDGFIDSQKLKSCMENAFDMIVKAVWTESSSPSKF